MRFRAAPTFGVRAFVSLLGLVAFVSTPVSGERVPTIYDFVHEVAFPPESVFTDDEVFSDSKLTEYERQNLRGHVGGSLFFDADKSIFDNSQSTHVNIWQKLKESLGQTIIGILLICVMPCLIWWNEGRHVKELKRIDYCKKTANSIDSSSASDETVGQLVHFRGPVSVDGAYLGSGDKFEVSVPGAVVLRRTCFIYQKIEEAEQKVEQDRLGGGETRTTVYSAREDWAMQPQPAQLEHVPDATNTRGIWDSISAAAGGSPSEPNLIISPRIHVGEFGLSRDVILEHPFQFLTEWSPVPAELLPASVAGCDGLEKGEDNVLRTFAKEEGPKNGDCKVVFEYVAEGFDCSFVAKQTGKQDWRQDAPVDAPLLEGGSGNETESKFGVEKDVVVDSGCCKFKEGDLGEIWMVQRGSYNLEEMIGNAKEQEKKILNIIRVLGWVLLCGGWIMLFSPFVTALQVLPILSKLGYFAVVLVALVVSCVCCCTVMALAYVRYRPLLGMGILALSLGIWGIIAWRLDYAAKNGGGQG